MLTKVPDTFEVLLYEGNGATEIAGGQRFAIVAGLLDKGYTVTRVTGTAQQPSAEDADRYLVLGDFSGQAPQLEAADGSTDLATRDISGLDEAAVLELVEQHRIGLDQPMNQPGNWKPWFPVIDYDRCTNCLQCLSFCLFDVYGVDDDKEIQVQNNDNCKTNCPACSRVCPEVAIMFPKYASGPINGEPVNESDVSREKMKVDISSLLGGDIYATLRDRSEKAKSRFSKERSPDKALTERKRCLTKLQQDGLIPAEVMAEINLADLPSPEEIKAKAEKIAALKAAQENP